MIAAAVPFVIPIANDIGKQFGEKELNDDDVY